MLQPQMKRKKLTKLIQDGNLKLDSFTLSAIRATKDGSLQAEFVQKRRLDGRRVNVLALMNEDDPRFGSNSTTLINWSKFTPKAILKLFPGLEFTKEELAKVAKSWKADAPTGTNAKVHPVMKTLKKMNVEGTSYTPVINVTELTESDLQDFYTDRSKRREENIAGHLEDLNNVMRTNAEDNEFLVDSSTGEKIFRLTRVNALEDGIEDIIVDKIPESQFKKAKKTSKKSAKGEGQSAEELMAQADKI